MEVKIKPFRALPCALETFFINGIRADKDDFGMGQDEKPRNRRCSLLWLLAVYRKTRDANCS